MYFSKLINTHTRKFNIFISFWKSEKLHKRMTHLLSIAGKYHPLLNLLFRIGGTFSNKFAIKLIFHICTADSTPVQYMIRFMRVSTYEGSTTKCCISIVLMEFQTSETIFFIDTKYESKFRRRTRHHVCICLVRRRNFDSIFVWYEWISFQSSFGI